MVVVVCVIYLAVLILARPHDIRDKQRKKVIYLQDNATSHQQKYEIVVETGCHSNAGTTSRVRIKLFHTEKSHLQKGHNKRQTKHLCLLGF